MKPLKWSNNNLFFIFPPFKCFAARENIQDIFIANFYYCEKLNQLLALTFGIVYCFSPLAIALGPHSEGARKSCVAFFHRLSVGLLFLYTASRHWLRNCLIWLSCGRIFSSRLLVEGNNWSTFLLYAYFMLSNALLYRCRGEQLTIVYCFLWRRD